MPLSDTAIRNAKPADKPVKLFDSGGLYLELSPAGGKLWRLKYRFNGKEKRLAFGPYPAVSLKDARERRDEAKKLLANGVDPGAVKKAQKVERLERAAHTFEAVARAWFGKWKTGVSDSTADSQWKRLTKHIMPALGHLPVDDINAVKVLTALRPLEDRGTGDTLRKCRTAISQIMRFAIQRDLAQGDPVPALRGAFSTTPVKHMVAITRPAEVGTLLRGIDAYQGQPEVVAALKLAPLVFVRIGELRTAK